jgi:hypothetical protein
MTKYKVGDVVKIPGKKYKGYGGKVYDMSETGTVKKIIRRGNKVRYHMVNQHGTGFTWVQDK